MSSNSQSPPTPSPDIRWMCMLGEYLPKYGIVLPENPGIVNVGCGDNVKWNYLGVAQYLMDQGLGYPNYTGIDIKGDAFADAKDALGDLVHFVTGDARHLSDLVSGTFHLAIVEHPPLTISPDGPKKWQRIFKEVSKVLDKNGGLILTSFWINDHIPAQMALERAGFEILHSASNKFPGRQFDTGSNGESLEYDKYVIIARRSLSNP